MKFLGDSSDSRGGNNWWMPLAILCATAVGTAAGQYVFKKLDERGYDVKSALRDYAEKILGPKNGLPDKSREAGHGYQKAADGKDI